MSDVIQEERLATEQIGILLSEDDGRENSESLMEMAALLLRHKKFLGIATLVLTGIATLAVYRQPPSYKADASILPPQQQQSSLSALMSGAMGGVSAGMASQLGLKTPADLYIGILKSRTIGDDLVSRFYLQQVYRTKLPSSARKALAAHTNFSNGKDSLITISVKDNDPHRASEMANAYVDELYKQNSRLAITDASQRRLFFEQQLAKEKDALADAEIALKQTQQSTGLLAPSGQAEALIRSGAQLRAEIASLEVELHAMRSYATDENSKVQIVKKEIEALQGQLSQSEASNAWGSIFEMSANRLPEAGLEYIRKMRDLKYHETLFEVFAKQYEASRIDEAKQAPIIQVVDRAVAPDKESGLSRKALALGSAIGAFLLSALFVLVLSRARKLLSDLNQYRLYKAC